MKTSTAPNKNGINKSNFISQGPREISKELLSRVLAKIIGEMLLGF
jgi:hypothetical protein